MLLQYRDLVIGYPGRVVAGPLAGDFACGEWVQVVGSNGSGKSTLLHTLAGILAPRAGTVVRAAAVRVAFVPQQQSVHPFLPLTAGEIVECGMYASGRGQRNSSGQWLELVGLSGVSTQLFRALSGGQQQRVLLARALAAEPNLLLLDESFTALDRTSRHLITGELTDRVQRNECTVISVVHSNEVLAGISPRTIQMGGTFPGAPV